MEREGYQHNPQKITTQAIDTAFDLVGSKPQEELREYWSGDDHEGIRFSDIFSDQFQMIRIGILGWQIELTDEQKERYGVQADTVDNMGKTRPEDPNLPQGYYHYFNSIRAIRTFVGGAFIEQAKIDEVPLAEIDINDDLIDAHPFKKQHIPDVRAEGEGAFMIDADDLEEQWGRENELLHGATMEIVDYFAERLTPESKEVLQANLPDGLVEELEPQIRDRWQQQLHETALRTYAIFTPNAPETISVPLRDESHAAG